MKRSVLLCISFIVVLAVPHLQAVEAVKPSGQVTILQEILILNSYHPGYAWSDDVQAGIIDLFREKDKIWIPVIEYLDLKRLPDGRHLAELKKLFRQKYQNKKFSVVIAMDNPALEFAIDNQAELFGNAPIVFCGINNYTPSLLKGRSNVTGIVEAIDIAGTIEVMLRLHPATQEIFVPHDYTLTGLAVRKEIEALIPRFGAKVRFRFTDPMTMDELLKDLERLPGDSLVLPISFITDKSGRTFGVTETTRLFSEHSPVPVYSTFEQRLGFGIVGGKLLSPRIHGADAARIALRVLAGEKASVIPVVLESDLQFMFDYTVMKRFGIPLSALPEGSTVINKPISFYAAHRGVIQAALGIIGILVIVISLLTVIIIQRRRSAIALRASEAKYYDLYENAPDMYFSVDVKTANITECNNTLVNTIGYAKEDIVGRSIFEIYHPDCREDAKRAFQQFVATGEIRNAELTIMRKDGSIIVVSLNASAVRDNKGNIIHRGSVWRDITECKRAEIRLARLNDCFLQFGVSSDDNINRLVAACGELMNATCALYNRLGKNLLCSVGQWRTPAGFKPEDKPDGHICYDVIQHGGEHPLLVRNLQESPYAGTDPNVLPYGLQTYLGMVVKWKQAAIGSLCVVYQADITPSNDDLQFMTIIASAIAVEEDRLRVEEALRESEENFRRSLDDSPLGVRIVTAEGETIYANQAILDMYGYDSIDELKTTPLKKRYTPESYAEFQKRMEKRKQGDYVPSEYEVSIVRKDGEVRHLQVFRKEILWNGEEQFQVIYQDITDRKQAEEELRASREQMRALAGRLQAVREEERTQIAREIHDELGGALTGLKIDFSLLTRAALKIEDEAVRTSLLAGTDSINKSIDTIIQTVRRIAMELRPGVLDDLGLVAALEWQLKDFEKRTGIRCEFFPPLEDISLDADLSTSLFRIFQEALTNVARHSGATEVRVRLHMDADSSTLELEDNGKGIQKKKTLSSKSLGLLGMRERAQMFGGRITVTGTPGIGTKVTVEIPPVEKRKSDRDQKGGAG
ncbi:MAG: PAS domain S-box protein [Proteobacteria bacterium]|nr:PAS domain S-box protein [Pseudomonadota bacterium]